MSMCQEQSPITRSLSLEIQFLFVASGFKVVGCFWQGFDGDSRWLQSIQQLGRKHEADDHRPDSRGGNARDREAERAGQSDEGSVQPETRPAESPPRRGKACLIVAANQV